MRNLIPEVVVDILVKQDNPQKIFAEKNSPVAQPSDSLR